MPGKSLKKNAALNIIRAILQLLFPLITFPYASRILLPEGIGKVNFAGSIVSYFSLIGSLGIGLHGVRECAKARNNRIDLSRITSELFTINLCSTLFSYLLFGIFIFTVPKLNEYKYLLYICGLSLSFNLISIDWLYNALEEYKYITIRSIIFQIISLFLLFALVKKKEDLLQYALFGILGSAGSGMMNFFYARKFIDLKILFNFNIKKHLKPVFTMFAMALAINIYTALDTTMVGFLADDIAVGIYSAANKLNKIVLNVINAACVTLLPRLSYYMGKNKTDQFSLLIHKGFNFLLCFSIPTAVGLFMLARPLILLFSGTNYLQAIPVMQVMTPIILVITISGLLGIQFFIPLGKEKITLISVTGGAIINFSLNFFLIPKYGAFGAAVSTVITETLITLFQIHIAKKYLNLKEISKNLFQFIFSSFLMGIAIYQIMNMVNNMILQILLSIVAGSTIYFILLLLLKNEFFLSLLMIIKDKFHRKRLSEKI